MQHHKSSPTPLLQTQLDTGEQQCPSQLPLAPDSWSKGDKEALQWKCVRCRRAQGFLLNATRLAETLFGAFREGRICPCGARLKCQPFPLLHTTHHCLPSFLAWLQSQLGSLGRRKAALEPQSSWPGPTSLGRFGNGNAHQGWGASLPLPTWFFHRGECSVPAIAPGPGAAECGEHSLGDTLPLGRPCPMMLW